MLAIQASRRQQSGRAVHEALSVIASTRIARTADANDVRHHPNWRFRVGIAPSGEIPSTSSILRGSVLAWVGAISLTETPVVVGPRRLRQRCSPRPPPCVSSGDVGHYAMSSQP